MASKRKATNIEPTIPGAKTHMAKRAKSLPLEGDQIGSSDASVGSVSEPSTLDSTPSGSQHERHSSMSSLSAPSVQLNDDDDDTMSTTTSESSDSDKSDSEPEIITVKAQKKPNFSSSAMIDGASDIRQRLASLLPHLARENERLMVLPGPFSMENVRDGEQHIEMNLGLGVLEEQDGDLSESSSSGSSEDEDEEDVQQEDGDAAPLKGKSNVMAKLMGQQPLKEKASIQDIG